MKRLKVKIGAEFDDLEVIDKAPDQCGKTRVYCRCVCGKVVERFLSALHKKSMFRKSCGCGKLKYGSRKRAQQKLYKDEGTFNPTAQKFYLGTLDGDHYEK